MDNIIFLSGFVAVFVCGCFISTAFENGKQQGYKEGFKTGYTEGANDVILDFKNGIEKDLNKIKFR